MAFVNFNTKEITAKIVYYGPGLGGKTSSLQYIYNNLPEENRGKMISLATDEDRTIYFDFLPLHLGKIQNFTVKVQLYTVPGQVRYNATRKLVLKGVDGIVFVADSQIHRKFSNIESYTNLEENLLEYQRHLKDIPHVIQYNKVDLPNIISAEELNKILNKYASAYFETCAITGLGIMDALKAISKMVFAELSKKGITSRAYLMEKTAAEEELELGKREENVEPMEEKMEVSTEEAKESQEVFEQEEVEELSSEDVEIVNEELDIIEPHAISEDNKGIYTFENEEIVEEVSLPTPEESKIEGREMEFSPEHFDISLEAPEESKEEEQVVKEEGFHELEDLAPFQEFEAEAIPSSEQEASTEEEAFKDFLEEAIPSGEEEVFSSEELLKDEQIEQKAVEEEPVQKIEENIYEDFTKEEIKEEQVISQAIPVEKEAAAYPIEVKEEKRAEFSYLNIIDEEKIKVNFQNLESAIANNEIERLYSIVSKTYNDILNYLYESFKYLQIKSPVEVMWLLGIDGKEYYDFNEKLRKLEINQSDILDYYFIHNFLIHLILKGKYLRKNNR